MEMMSELVGDGCNTVNPATYCDISNVGADKVSYCCQPVSEGNIS